MFLPNAIRLQITTLLKENDLSTHKLAYKSGISPSNISDILKEKVSKPTLYTLLHICESLNITLKDFFDNEIFKNVQAIDRKDKKIKVNVKIKKYMIYLC